MNWLDATPDRPRQNDAWLSSATVLVALGLGLIYYWAFRDADANIVTRALQSICSVDRLVTLHLDWFPSLIHTYSVCVTAGAIAHSRQWRAAVLAFLALGLLLEFAQGIPVPPAMLGGLLSGNTLDGLDLLACCAGGALAYLTVSLVKRVR